MRILFVHCNYPAQFRHLSQHLAADENNEVVFLCQNKEWTASNLPRLKLARYQLGREPKGELCHPYLRRYETAVLHGQAALREALRLRQTGFEPDLIIGHSGFGNTLSQRGLAQRQIHRLFRMVLSEPGSRCVSDQSTAADTSLGFILTTARRDGSGSGRCCHLPHPLQQISFHQPCVDTSPDF